MIDFEKVTSHFGAQVFGSDIDGRQMRGKGRIMLPESEYIMITGVPISP